MKPELPRAGDHGFSLLEVLLALAITIVVMAMVAQTMAHVAAIYRAQSDIATTSSGVSLALEDIAYEIALAGQGLGEGTAAVLPRLAGGDVGASALTLRSNPQVAASLLRSAVENPGEAVAADAPELFHEGDRVLLTDLTMRSERAEVVRSETASLSFRSLDTRDGLFHHRYAPERGARVLGLREVRYLLDEDTGELVKDIPGVSRRVLARGIVSIAFDYLDFEGKSIATGKVEGNAELAAVRVTLHYEAGEPGLEPRALTTAVALTPSSGTVDFERPDRGFRLSRVFYPIDHPAGVASRIGADRAVILASGADPHSDPAYLYTFEMQPQFLSARVDDVVWLEDVRAPVTLAFGPDAGPLAGSLFVAAWGLRMGHLARVAPDDTGGFSTESEVTAFEGTEAIAQAGGISFGVDGALYVTSQEKGALYRFRFDEMGNPGKPERLFSLTGTPGPIAEGTDGHLYFLMDHGDRGSLWKTAFDETLTPTEPVRVGALAGSSVSLARDPVGGNLFALVRDAIGDFLVLELPRAFLRSAEESSEAPPEPRVVFSLREWQTKLEEGAVHPSELPFPTQELPQNMSMLRTKALDFLSFDQLGSLYLGAGEANLVLKFELDRPSGLYSVGVAAGVVERGAELPPVVKIHAWKTNSLGL